MTIPTPIIAAEDLIVLRGKIEVLNVQTFHLSPGEVLTLIGPNGSGKTTFLLTLNGLLKPQKGRIFFRGQRLRTRSDMLRYRRRTATVFQVPLLFDTTVFNNVATGLKIRGMNGQEIRDRVLQSLERLNIAHLAHRSARKLSGGEAQRTALARALAVDPEVIFLDEPFSDLDLPMRQTVITDLEKVIRENGITAVLVTHDRSEALRFSDRVMFLKEGKIIQEGSIQEIRERPADPFMARFFGIEKLIP